MKGQAVPLHRDIIEKARNGVSEAQFQLYSLYQKAMFNVAYRITADEMDAEDALQDAFVSAFQHMDQYREEASFGAWLKRIVINKSLTLIKKKRRWESEDEVTETEEPYYEWEPVAEKQMQVAQVRSAMEHLPDGFRTVLSLYLFEGYDHGEIAEILGITVSTSKSQYNRAKKKLREMIHKEVKYG